MIALQLTPVVLSLLVLGAHFLRTGNGLMLAAVVVLLIFLGVRRPWAARTVQIALLLGVVEWMRTVLLLSRARIDAGQPYLRLVIILGAVVLVTLGAALVFQTRTLRRLYGLTGSEARHDIPPA